MSGAGARSGKRAFDLLLGTTILLLASPLLAGLAAAVRLDSPGPAWFRQRRLGLGGRPFSIIKFRTMRHGSTRLGTGLETSRDDFRITRVGRILRNLRLDELPQLCNVLMGEMSLVGPRPLLPEFLPYYSPFDRRRLEVLPGMTGWQQVNGAARHSWRERVALDVWYVDHPSLALDLRILWMTVGVLLRADTVYAPDGSQKSGLPDAYVAAQEAGLHVRALPGHGVGESEGGRRASNASGRSPLSDIGADTVYAPDGSQKSGLPDAYVAAQEAGLHVRALPGHGVGESEGGRRASNASGRSPLSDIGADTVYAPDGSQKSGLPDAYVAAQEAGLHVRALPGHGVGESEGGRRASNASGRSPLSDIGADTVYAPDGSQKSGLPDAYMAAQRTEKEAE